MKKIKIAFIITSLEIGGAERVFLNLLKVLDQTKFEPKVFILKKQYQTSFEQELFSSQVDYVFLNKKSNFIFDVFAFNKLSKELIKFSPDIIHSHLKVGFYLLKYKQKNPQVKWIHTHHTNVDLENKYLRKYLMKYLYKKRKIIPVCVSEAVKESLIRTYKLVSDDIKVIYNGIDIDCFFYERKQQNNDGLLISHIGRFDKIKNHYYLISEFVKFFRTYKMARLCLVGSGKEKAKMMKYVKSLGLQDVITFLDPTLEVENILKKTDIFVLSSFYEGNSLSLLEAMASGCVVLASNVGGNKEVIEDGINGYLFPLQANKLFEKLVYLNNRRNLLYAMSRNNNDKSRNYTINKMKLAYEELYLDHDEN